VFLALSLMAACCAENDPKGPKEGHLVGRRGGAWHTDPLYARRLPQLQQAGHPLLNLGFRVVREK
jgi:hypothetical protein